jgi:NAD-dependent dihydropyrimidine dehydrogenase PreA subunit
VNFQCDCQGDYKRYSSASAKQKGRKSMKRNIIRIDESLCNGCGSCIPNCPEGAIQMIDGKARLISDLFCDGLGACLGHCPEGAITVEEREAEPYDERKVMENIIKAGPNTLSAHLQHLSEHGENELHATAMEVLAEKGIEPPASGRTAARRGGCPGSAEACFPKTAGPAREPAGAASSELTHWPVQLHLISPSGAAFRGADVLLAADCAAYASGDFHRRFIRGKAVAIACPKLDQSQEVYLSKIGALIDEALINSLTVVIMEVPCCGGLLRLAQQAAAGAKRKVPVKSVVLSRTGKVIREEWI